MMNWQLATNISTDKSSSLSNDVCLQNNMLKGKIIGQLQGHFFINLFFIKGWILRKCIRKSFLTLWILLFILHFLQIFQQDQTLVCHLKLIIKCKTIENNIIKLYIFWKLNNLSNKIWKKINKCCHGDLRVFKYFQNGSKSCEKYRHFNFEPNYLDQIQP